MEWNGMEWNRLYSQTLLSVSQSQVKSQVLKVFLRVLVLVLVLSTSSSG